MTNGLMKILSRCASYEEIKKLIKARPSLIFWADKNFQTPLHKASELGNYEAANLLLVWGANPNAKDKMGHTPLHLSVIYQNLLIARLLISNNAAANSVSKSGKNCLHFLATQKENDEIFGLANLFLRHGVSCKKPDNKNFTPKDLAKEFGNQRLLSLFEKF